MCIAHSMSDHIGHIGLVNSKITHEIAPHHARNLYLHDREMFFLSSHTFKICPLMDKVDCFSRLNIHDHRR